MWNPPFDLLPLVVHKIEAEHGRGLLVAQHWAAQAWFARLCGLSSRMVLLDGDASAETLLVGEQSLNSGWDAVLAEMM